jgi:hypothetical protein
MSTKIPESHNSLPIGSPDNLVEAETQVKQSRPEEASARPEQEKLQVGVINLESVLLGSDGIRIEYTWVQGGKQGVSYTLPLGKVRKMVESGVVCISNYSPGSTVEENLAKLGKFLEDQEKLIRKREWNSLADTAFKLSNPSSKNPTEVPAKPHVSTGGQSSEAFTLPETDTVVMQMQTDFADQQPTDSVDQQPRGSAEQELDSGNSFGSRVYEISKKALENDNYYQGLGAIEKFLSSKEFKESELSPANIQLIANAILTIVNRGIQSEGLQFVNYFLMQYPRVSIF